MVQSDSEHIEVKGYMGKWYVIDSGVYSPENNPANSRQLFLLEHETYGDETSSLIIDEDVNVVLDDVWNGFEDLKEAGWEHQESEIVR